MYNHLLFLAFWLTNSLVLFLSFLLIPDKNVVLGNWRFNSFETSLYAGFWLTFLFWVCWDFAIARQLKSDKRVIAFLQFVVVNVVSVWIVSRFYQIIGFQLVHYSWALAIGFAATIFQALAWKLIVKRTPFPA